MIRLLILTTITVLLYLSFVALSAYDSTVHIEAVGYSITVSGFFLIAITVMTSVVISAVIKFIAFLFNIPSLIASRIKTSIFQQNIRDLLEAYSSALCEDSTKAQKIATRLKNELPPEYVIHTHTILSKADVNPEQRTYHLRYILDSGTHKSYAAKKIAQYFIRHKYYQQGLEFLQKAIGYNGSDPELAHMAIDLYAHLLMWDEFEVAISQLEKMDEGVFNNYSEKIACHYFAAAKDSLSSGSDANAIHYLEKALTYKVDLLEAIDLLCALNISSGNIGRNQHFLEDAFKASPSFEIFELYNKSVTLPSEEIYSNLTSNVDAESYRGLLVGIAAYLGLPDRINALKSISEQYNK
ncbi:MAG: hypothetical protein V4485_05975 [Pseudomonadota bacterium]